MSKKFLAGDRVKIVGTSLSGKVLFVHKKDTPKYYNEPVRVEWNGHRNWFEAAELEKER